MPPAPRGPLDSFFGLSAAGSSVPQELRAGLTTFLTMSYILFVNPQVLGNLPPGEFVKLRGQMYQRDNGDSTWAPAYRVATVERQRM